MKKLFYIFLVALCCTVGLQAQNNDTHLWVNEIHYDGSSSFGTSDANEFVELIVHNDILNNPTELAKYQLVLYSAGASLVDENSAEAVKGLPYDKSSLLYSSLDTYHSLDTPQASGGFQVCSVADMNYSVLSKEMPVLQDLPAALALIYNNNTVIQLISYEKRFKIRDNADAGAAAALMTDLMTTTGGAAVTESTLSDDNHSIQLRGTGAGYDDFGWNSAINNTASPCSVNSGQTISMLAAVNDDPLAVQMIDFIGEAQNESIALSWRTATESNNKGFYLERRRSDEAAFTTLDFITGKGTTNETQVYNYLDTQVKMGQVYYYRLNQVDNNDRKTTSNTIAIKLIGSDIFMNATPNPAKDVVNVRLENIQNNATLQVTSMDGKVMKTIDLAAAKAQNYNLNIADLSTGFYLLRVENGQEVLTHKLSVL